MPTWIFYSLLMFLASNGLYLLIRFAQKQGIALSFYSIFLFLVPSLIYFTSAQALAVPLWVGYERLALILAAGFIWSFVGNFASQKAISLAANPGYSLVIQKSAAVFTTLAAVWLFGAEFQWSKFMAILLILGLILFMNMGERAKQPAGKKWLLFSVLANLCFTFGQLMSKYFLNLEQVRPDDQEDFLSCQCLKVIDAVAKRFRLAIQKASLISPHQQPPQAQHHS